MAYDENLAVRIREQLAESQDVLEKEMMGGLVFMVDGKMCIGIIKDEMMCRIAPELYPEILENTAAANGLYRQANERLRFDR